MSDNIKVVVKVRPLIKREIDEKLAVQWRISDNTLYQIDHCGKDGPATFTFDKVYDENAVTSTVYDDIAKPIVEAATAGIHGTIFAYGQTSSGKTFTMTGTPDSPGIVPLAVLDLFKIIKSKEDRDFLVRVSYMEIYNDSVNDLLDMTKVNIKIHDLYNGPKYEVTEFVTSTPDEVLDVMKKGEANRQTGATNMNEGSSRSHSIFQITIESRQHASEGCVNVSQLNLVDLAGSERSGQTGATGMRFKEGTHINKSLSTLALVIKQLSEDNRYVSYRDSKLTHILKNSLGGNAKTSIICTVTPAVIDETISTFQFANRAKAIKNKPVVNAVTTDKTMIQDLTKQLAQLQTQLESKKDVEKDNHLLTVKIATLKRQILNGFNHMSANDHGNRRKTWCAPRRMTIDTLPSIDENKYVSAIPKFCTPGLKYNPLAIPGGDLIPLESFSRMSRVSEESGGGLITPPPPTKKSVNFTEEIIELDSDDDAREDNEACSPYHKCHGTSKTPPCVLREKARKAEQNYQDIVDLTNREKLYAPDVNELMDKIFQNTTVIEKLKDEINTLNQRHTNREAELIASSQTLQTKVHDLEKEIQTISSEKIKLETICKECTTKITDLEVSYETLQNKSKIREQELLSLLNEQNSQHVKSEESKALEKELLNFMDVSKDISLVQSDNETSVVNEAPQIQTTLLADLQSQITSKNQLITDMEMEIESYKQKIGTLETENDMFQTEGKILSEKIDTFLTENTLMSAKLETLRSIETNLKENLDKANSDIEKYDLLVQELNIKLNDSRNKALVMDDSKLQKMIDNEEKIISNNDNLRNIILSMKKFIEIRDKEIEDLKSAEVWKKDEAESNIKEVNALTNDVSRLKQVIDQNVQQINSMSNEKEELILDRDNLQNRISIIEKEMIELKQTNENVVSSYSNLSTEFNDLTTLSKQLQYEAIKSNERIFELESNLTESIQANDDLMAKNTELLDQFTNLTNLLEQVQKDTSVKSVKIQTLENKITDLMSTIISTHKIISRIMQDFSEEKTNLSIPDESVDHMTIVQSLLDDVKSLELIVTASNKETANLKSDIQSLQVEITDMSRKNENALLEYECLQKSYDQLCLDKDDTQSQLNKVLNELDALKRESIVTLDTKDQELESYKNKLKELERVTTSLQTEINNLTESSEQKNNVNINILEKEQQILDLTDELQKQETNNSILSSKMNAVVDQNTEYQDKLAVLDYYERCIEKIHNALCNMTRDYNIPETEHNKEKLPERILLVLEKVLCHIKQLETKSKTLETTLSATKSEISESMAPNLDLQESKYRDDYRDTCSQLNELQNVNSVLTHSLTQCNDLIKSLNRELQSKAEELDQVKISSQSLQEKFVSLDRSLNNKLMNLKADNTELSKTCSDLECKIKEMTDSMLCNKCSFEKPLCNILKAPKSLISLSCTKVMEFMNVNNNEFNITPTISSTTMEKDDQNPSEVCKCNELETQLTIYRHEIKNLRNTLNYFKLTNKELLEEQQQVREEIKLLLEPAKELQKKVSNHRTVLSSLTATTYTENRLLKSQVKFLEHHHKRFHNICKRDIPEFKKQLIDLMLTLRSDGAFIDRHNSSFKRFSLPVVLDNNMTISTLRNESTLDGDLLMLDNNFTLNATNVDNTLTCNDQTCFDISQVYVENDTQYSTENLNLLPVPEQSSIEVLIGDNKKMCEMLHTLKEENNKLKEHVLNCSVSLKKSDKSSDSIQCMNKSVQFNVSLELNGGCDLCKGKDIPGMITKIESLTKELNDLQTTYINIDSKYQNLTNDLEKDFHVKVTKLNDQLAVKTREWKQLQEENDALSSQIMDSITEVDDVKKELDEMKAVNLDLKRKCLHYQNAQINKEGDKTDRYSKLCSLRNTLHASKEDCRKITEEVTTMKNQLERSNMSITQNMDLDDSMSDSNIFNLTKDLKKINDSHVNLNSEKTIDIYSTEKAECMQYYCEMAGLEKENLNRDLKMVDIMEMFYNKLLLQHDNEIQNLNNKLQDQDTLLQKLRSEISNFADIERGLEKSKESMKCISEVIHRVQGNIKNLALKTAANTKDCAEFVHVYKNDVLIPLDTCFNIETTDIFDALVNSITAKCHEESTEIIERYNTLQNYTQSANKEFEKLKETLNDIKGQLSSKEEEYNLLKAQKEKIHEISSAVTRDIIHQERSLRQTLRQGCQKLVQHDIIKLNDFDLEAPLQTSISNLFEILAIQGGSNSSITELEQQKQILIAEAKNTTALLDEKKSELDLIKTQSQSSIDNLNKEIHELQKNVLEQKSSIAKLQDELSSNKSNIDEERNELLQKLHALNLENNRLKSINDELCGAKDECAIELQKASDTLLSHKQQIENMTLHLYKHEASCKEHVADIEALKIESKLLLENNKSLENKNYVINSQAEELLSKYKEKCEECTQLELNNKTHEKTVQIQSNMINRLQKEKEDMTAQLAEKSAKIEELSGKCDILRNQLDSSKETLNHLETLKNTLEVRVTELECQNHSAPKGRESLDVSVRRRRQSFHDSKRLLPELHTEHENGKLEEMFASRSKPDDLFLDAEDGSSNRSSPIGFKRESICGSAAADEGRVSAARLRRRSIHDAHRNVAESSIAKQLKCPRDSKSPDTSAYEANTSVSQLRAKLEACTQELQDLKEKYKELDDECETCAEYLRERDEQCMRLKKEKDALLNTVSELRLSSSAPRRGVATKDAFVNTDEDWANLHSVVVDRMSFDAEVEKNKKLTKAVEEFRFKNRELKATLSKMHRVLEKNSSNDINAISKELEAARREVEKLRTRCQELDDECETCSQYLNEKEEQCLLLKKQCAILESKLHCTKKDAATHTGDDLLSYQVERDGAPDGDHMTVLQKRAPRADMLVSTGSAIVQNQQLTDIMKENKKLKIMNAKLVNICKKRTGKSEDNRENEFAEQRLTK